MEIGRLVHNSRNPVFWGQHLVQNLNDNLTTWLEFRTLQPACCVSRRFLWGCEETGRRFRRRIWKKKKKREENLGLRLGLFKLSTLETTSGVEGWLISVLKTPVSLFVELLSDGFKCVDKKDTVRIYKFRERR